MSEFRDLQAKLQQIEESYFSDLDLELQEFRRANKDLPADQLVALAREKYGQEAASFISDKIEREADLADYEASDPQPHMRDPHPADSNWPHPVEEADGDITYLKHPEGYEPAPVPERHVLDGIDWMYVQDNVIQMMKSLEHKMVSQKVWDKGVALAGGEDKLWKVIQWNAEEIEDRYHGSGDGIGSSDMNAFVRGVFSDIGEPDIWGWDKKLASDEDMERDKANRAGKFNKAIRGVQETFSDWVDDFTAPSDEREHRFDHDPSFSDEEPISAQVQSLLAQGKSVICRISGASGVVYSANPKDGTIVFKDENFGEKVGLDVDSKSGLEIQGNVDHYAIVQYTDENELDEAGILRKAGANRTLRKVVPGLGKREADQRADDNFFDGALYRDMEWGTGEDDGIELTDKQKEHKRRAYKTGQRYNKISRGYAPFKDILAREGMELDEDRGRVVEVPPEFRGTDPDNSLGGTSRGVDRFLADLGPDDSVDTEVVDPETGELLDWPTKGTRRDQGQKEYEKQETERKEREQKDHEEGHDSPYLYVPGLDKDPENAWEGIQTLKYDREFTEFYHIVWKSVREASGEPFDLGSDAEDWGELDYDVDVDMPVAIKRTDGKKFNMQDRQNFDMINKIFRAATHNIGVQYVGSSNEGTVARFIPSFM